MTPHFLGMTKQMSRLEASVPPQAAQCVRRWTLSTYAELRTLRSDLQEVVADRTWPPGRQPDPLPEKIALVASELATNALEHTAPPAVVELRRTDTTFIVDVADTDPSRQPELAAERPRGTGGHGLRLARRLARDLGWYVQDKRKHVWAQITAPPA
jgi:anti-sigma regulatory factor (Ser/Thr protein kinase)